MAGQEDLHGRQRELEQKLERNIRELELAKREMESIRSELVRVFQWNQWRGEVLVRKDEKDTEKDELVSFPRYKELPDLVRRKIMSLLTPKDLLSVARGLPSEVKYFPVPLSWIQMREVFSLLLDKDLLDKESLLQLIGVNSYFGAFVRMTMEQFLREDGGFLVIAMLNYTIALDRLAESKPEVAVALPVTITLSRGDRTPMTQLKDYGDKIWHCNLKMARGTTLQEELVQVALALRMMPNLKTLRVENECHPEEENETVVNPKILNQLPNLPGLKTLLIDNRCMFGTHLKNALLLKYGANCQLVFLPVPEVPQEEPEMLLSGDGATLERVNIQCIGFINGESFICPGLNRFAACPLKKLDFLLQFVPGTTPEAYLPRLLTLLVKHWGDSLELLNIQIRRETEYTPEKGDDPEANEWNEFWGLRKDFPRLKQFQWMDYPVPRECYFLMAFPALEELGYNMERKYFVDGEERHEDPRKGPRLLCDKDRMIKSKLWETLPNLKEIWFEKKQGSENETVTVTVTRKQWEKLEEEEGQREDEDLDKNAVDKCIEQLESLDWLG